MKLSEFKKLSQQEKAVAVVKDVLLQLSTAKYIAKTGTYIRPQGYITFEGDYRSNFDKLPPCQVCALGSMLLSATNLGNILTTNDLNLHSLIWSSHLQESDNVNKLFSSIFSQKQLLLIETAFEGYDDFKGYTLFDIDKNKEDFNYRVQRARYADKEELTFDETRACHLLYDKYETSEETLKSICNNIIDNNGVFIP